jgi:hypothetical protein
MNLSPSSAGHGGFGSLPESAKRLGQGILHLGDLPLRNVTGEGREYRRGRRLRIDRPDVRQPFSDLVEKLIERMAIARLPCGLKLVVIDAPYQERELRSQMGGQIDLQAVPQLVQDSAQHLPGQLPVGANRLFDLTEPDMGGLDRLVEDLQL